MKEIQKTIAGLHARLDALQIGIAEVDYDLENLSALVQEALADMEARIALLERAMA